MGGKASKPRRRLLTVKLFNSAALLKDPISPICGAASRPVRFLGPLLQDPIRGAATQPVRFLGLDEWRPGDAQQWRRIWRSPFAKSHLESPAAMLSTMTTDMRHDVILMYETLFSVSAARSPPAKIPLTLHEENMYNRRVLFLKRLFLCFAVCGLTYCCEENSIETHAWPFPLASALCHGSRVLIRLEGVDCFEFTNFLLLGDAEADEGDVPSPLFTRWAATHAVGFDEPTSQLYEESLTLSQSLRNLNDGMQSKHLGLDLPVGGFANSAPTDGDNMHIGPSGVPYRIRKVEGAEEVIFDDEMQHGHLYMRRDNFGNSSMHGTDHVSAILLGIESSAPQKMSFFCGKHTIAAKKQKTSAFGSRKWKDYRKGGLKVPADVGGMHISIDTVAFHEFQELCTRANLSKPYDGCITGSAGEALRQEKDLFKELLESSDEQVVNVLRRRLEFIRPVFRGGQSSADSISPASSSSSETFHC